MPNRTYIFHQAANERKAEKLHLLVEEWRSTADHIASIQWKIFYKTGSFDKYLSTSEYDSNLASSKLQAIAWQVVGVLQSWISNRKHEFTCMVERSSISGERKHQLHVINKLEAWFQDDKIEMDESGEVISEETRKIARKIFKRCMSRHRKPDLSSIHPLMDQRMTSLEESENSKKFSWWANISTTESYETIDIPLFENSYFREKEGDTKKSVQLVSKDDELSFRIFKEHDFEEKREGYEPETDILGLDFGLRNLFTSSEGDLLGKRFISKLKYYDQRITELARHRQKHGLDVRSKKYDERVEQLRGFLKSEINRILNRLIEIHKPAKIILEDLDFQHPSLSRRMNRVLGWCGRSVLEEKLDALEEEYGIKSKEVAAHYTSKSCSNCGYPDKKNRSGEEFECRFCGMKKHADVNAACNVVSRRSWDDHIQSSSQKSMVLSEQIKKFRERFSGVPISRNPGSHGDPADLLHENRYFGDSLKEEVISKWNDFASST